MSFVNSTLSYREVPFSSETPDVLPELNISSHSQTFQRARALDLCTTNLVKLLRFKMSFFYAQGDFHRFMSLKEVRRKITKHQKHLYRCRIVGVVSCAGQAFSLHEPFDETTKVRVSLMYMREAMPYYGMSFTAQLFGFAHWREGLGPVLYPLHVTSISPSAAWQSCSSMQWVIDNHMAKNQEAADVETASQLNYQQSLVAMASELVPSTSASPSRRVEEDGSSHWQEEAEEALSDELYIRTSGGYYTRYVRAESVYTPPGLPYGLYEFTPPIRPLYEAPNFCTCVADRTSPIEIARGPERFAMRSPVAERHNYHPYRG